jgi:Domain of unknown function (DUF5069)
MWIPRSGRDEVGGCIWLPRMIQKARRIIETGESGKRTGEYMYGKHDPADAQVLKFLGISDEEILDIVRAIPDDDAAAMQVLSTSGKTREQCEAFSRRYWMLNAPFMAMMDADEGRRTPGPLTSLLRWFYNNVIMPPAYAYFKMKER